MIPALVAALFLAAVVAAAAVALVIAQRSQLALLRSLLAEKREHERRVERVQSGMSELPPQEKKPDLCPPGLQVRIDQAIGQWGSGAIQEQKRNDVAVWRAEGRDWAWIAAELEREEEPD